MLRLLEEQVHASASGTAPARGRARDTVCHCRSGSGRRSCRAEPQVTGTVVDVHWQNARRPILGVQKCGSAPRDAVRHCVTASGTVAASVCQYIFCTVACVCVFCRCVSLQVPLALMAVPVTVRA